jgi:TolA-binding protein
VAGSRRAIEAQANIVRMYISVADERNATAWFARLIEKFSGDEDLAWAVWYVAERYWDFGSFDKAAEKYEYVVEHWPQAERAIWAKMRLVMSLIKQRELVTAEQKLGELLSDYAGTEHLAEAVHEIVEEYRDSGVYEEGRGLFAYLLENRDAGAGTGLELQVGVVLQSIKLGEPNKADAAVDKLIADYNEHPNIGKALFQIAEEYYYTHGYGEAIYLLELIERCYPSREFAAKSEVPFVLATCCRELNDYENAIGYYEKAIREYPTARHSELAPYLIGTLYMDVKKEYEQALYWFEQQRQLYPDSDVDRSALYFTGELYLLRSCDYVKAAEAFEEYIASYPRGIDVWTSYRGLAKCYAELGDLEHGLAVLQAAYENAEAENVRLEIGGQISALEKGGAQ